MAKPLLCMKSSSWQRLTLSLSILEGYNRNITFWQGNFDDKTTPMKFIGSTGLQQAHSCFFFTVLQVSYKH